MKIAHATFLVRALFFVQFVFISAAAYDHDSWEFHGGKKKRRKFGLNAVVDNYDENSQIIVTNDEAEGPNDGMAKKGKPFSFLNSREEYTPLPERPSVLTFGVNDYFAEDDDEESEKVQSENAFWGRLYLSGFPRPLQYFRAHFGIPPPSDFVSFILASPLDMCDNDFKSRLDNKNMVMSNTIIVTKRGNCTFGEKAIVASNAGAFGILYLNNEDGNSHPPGPDTEGISISPTMISRQDGQHVMNALSRSDGTNSTSLKWISLIGRFVQISCIQSTKKDLQETPKSHYCQPIRAIDRHFVSSINYEGSVVSSGNIIGDWTQAEFGSKVNSDEEMTLVYKDDGCDTDFFMNGAAGLVQRGGCSFLEKAENLAKAGAGAMILIDTRNKLNSTSSINKSASIIRSNPSFRMGAEPKYLGNAIMIPLVMVSFETGELLIDLLEKDNLSQQNTRSNATMIRLVSNVDAFESENVCVQKNRSCSP